MFSRITSASIRSIVRCQRSVHTVPQLKNQDVFLKNGIEGLYTPKGFEASWLQYQKYLTMNLTLLTNGTEGESRPPYQILLNTARQTLGQHTFHFASQAHNNHLMFEQLTNASEAQQSQPSRYLLGRLADAGYNNIEEFRDAFLSVAELSIGQGWVFLVEDADKSVRILRCNNDGTPYYYGKNQSLDLNGGVNEGNFEQLNLIKEAGTSNKRDFTLPILGISFWDTSYINDYGVNGKKEYLQSVWKCIDWNVVNGRLLQL
ncbi:manganese and iron superoxide dismutase [Yamadazyma tenuis]|uniref:Manganese and iron superoxide dismutase n=1 Tax=Candida tenuis (strain ATCC 10573 / BCRC 21748 / CBS 615 / JCM 9827 / NBRC 10315 / NRRL Y-1498 / VKM Y-70) TaxID=590646 RepID=G3BDC7_CANTC|nr:manganese and iron superoxide dismutase [Yamadazyma tenuis ATCC 10573]EGV60928.1 manganese and iron superoxide dismutase [Yamadazyma tenuis ATCC 10573]WEJ93798.1 manganese and iron superoxide dismutase [Yamadazyma tenuis]